MIKLIIEMTSNQNQSPQEPFYGKNPANAARMGFGSFPLVLLIGLGSFMVWLVWVSRDPRDWDSPLASWMILKAHSLQPQTFFVHTFFYDSALHFLVSIVALLYAGRLLEARWGSIRFGIFYLFVSISTAVITVLTEYCVEWFSVQPPPPEAWTYGGGASSLACLAVWSRVDSKDWAVFWIAKRYVFWALVLLGSTFLVLLELNNNPNDTHRLFLLPQLSGLLFGWIFALILPRVDRVLLLWEVRRHRAQEEDVLRIRKRVDQLLEKIAVDGMDSLSDEERSFLKQASKHYRGRI